jgi:hypothetical protein
LSGDFELPQIIKDIAFLEADIVRFIKVPVAPGRLKGIGGYVDGKDRFTRAGKMERECSGVRKTIERAAGGVCSGGHTVPALVQEKAGFLAQSHIDQETDAFFPDFDLVGNIPVKKPLRFFQTLERPRSHIVPLQYAGRVQELPESVCYEWFQHVRPIGQCLQNQIPVVSIHDNGRQHVAFPENQPTCGTLTDEWAPPVDSAFDPGADKLRGRRRIGTGDQPQAYLRATAVKGTTKAVPRSVFYHNNRRGCFPGFPDNVARIYPEMAAAQPLNGSGGYLYPVFNSKRVHGASAQKLQIDN